MKLKTYFLNIQLAKLGARSVETLALLFSPLRRQLSIFRSLRVQENVIIVGRHPPVLVVVVLLGIVLLVVGEESVELETLLEILDGLHTSELLQEIEVAVGVDASADKSVPMNALEFQVSVVLLELEVEGFVEIYVRALNRVHILSSHNELVCVEILGEDLHSYKL
mgnify:CR=1 FL=1